MDTTLETIEEPMHSADSKVKPKKSKLLLTDREEDIIKQLKMLYMETINLDISVQLEANKIEKSYEDRYNAIYDERKKILDDFRKQNHGDSTVDENVNHFWLKVLKVACEESINLHDEKVLAYLSDVRSRVYTEPEVKFDLEFHFDKNEYFSNSVLTKTYYVNCLPDPEDPLMFEGSEIYKREGCTIDWKSPRISEGVSFFDFFSPPTLPPNDTDDYDEYIRVHAILNHDSDTGVYLRERVIPKAVIFLTREIADCEIDDSEGEADAAGFHITEL